MSHNTKTQSIVLLSAFLLAMAFAACRKPTDTGAANDKAPGNKSEAGLAEAGKGPPEADPRPKQKIRVLIRKRETGRLEAGGKIFEVFLMRADRNAQPDLKGQLHLFTENAHKFFPENTIEIEEEASYEVEEWGNPIFLQKAVEALGVPDKLRGYEQPGKKTKTAGWRQKTKDFDFVVYNEIVSKERPRGRQIYEADLLIFFNETWKVEKVADQKIRKSWNCAYQIKLSPMMLYTDKELLDKNAMELTESNIAPARGPILKDIRAFLYANKPEPTEARSVAR